MIARYEPEAAHTFLQYATGAKAPSAAPQWPQKYPIFRAADDEPVVTGGIAMWNY